MCFAFNFMHDWKAVTNTVHLAPRYQGGSLIVSTVLWLLSSRNTLSVTHSDTASRPTSLQFKRYYSFKIVTILQEMDETLYEAGANWKESFLNIKDAQYI